MKSPVGDVDRDDALTAAILDDEVGAEMLVQTFDAWVFDRRLEQRVQHMEAGLVGSKPRALDLHAAESTHIDVTIRLAAPGAAPMFHLNHLLGAMGNEIVDDVLVAQPVAAGHGIVEMMFQAVVRLHHAGRSPFRRHGVAAHRIDLGHQREFSASESASAAAIAARSPAPPAPTMAMSTAMTFTAFLLVGPRARGHD